MTTISDETIEVLRHIIQARFDNSHTKDKILAWGTARDIIEYALADNLDALRQFDYLPTIEECWV